MTTGSELVRTAGAQVAEVTAGRRRFADLPDEIKDLTRHVLVPSKTATDAEVEWCLAFAEQRGLSPLNGQIYFMPAQVKDKETGRYREGLVPVTGIAGWRLLAERSGKYEGSSNPQWLRRDGTWVDVWIGTNEEPHPLAARVEVYRVGYRVPVCVPVKWSEFAQTTNDGGLRKTWKEKPSYMLGKCAEVASLRKAFPEELADFRDEDDPVTVEVGEVIDVDGSEASAPEGERGGGGSGEPGAAASADPLGDAADQALDQRRRREPDDDPPPEPPLPGQEQLV